MYSHRNGETAAPTEPGIYWFHGAENTGFNPILIAAPVRVLDVTDGGWVRLIGDEGEYEFGDLAGRWWGPLTPPWDQEAHDA